MTSLLARTITHVVKPKQKKKCVPQLLSRDLLKSSVTETLKELAVRKMEKNHHKKVNKRERSNTKEKAFNLVSKVNFKFPAKIPTNTIQQPIPSNSGFNNMNNSRKEDKEELTSCSEDLKEEENKCCMRTKWETKAIR